MGRPDGGSCSVTAPETHGLAGRVVAITGASRGVGRALAESFAKSGALLGLFARDEAAVKELGAQLPSPSVAVACDVCDPDAVSDALAQLAERFGGVDSVVANAGIAPASHRAQNMPLDTWRDVLNVNLTGAFVTARAAYRYLAEAGAGRLVLTSSVMARAPRRGITAYVASKAGIEGLTRALAADWASDGICVNAVAPGFMDAGLGTAFNEVDRLQRQVLARTPLNRFGEVFELGEVVRFLASESCGYMTGQVLSVDGGYGLG